VLLVLESPDHRVIVRRTRLLDRLMAMLRAPRLDAELAAGASPDSRPELALRARLLVSVPTRRRLARTVERLVATAQQPPTARCCSAVPVCWDRVRDSAPELRQLAMALAAPGPVPARGVALVMVLLCDGAGPLYRRAAVDDLAMQVRHAAKALDPRDWR
jgi:hypothetical protein